ncbi:MAG: hypothetical protein NPIRA02_18680 [Nitrospirales bacterium]|nr:MAG: hypothetical protein NPIRA02_18680 [Nitrospirales bacterium]
MLRIIILIAILVLLLAAFFLPQFRRALWITLAGVVSVVALIIWLDNRERERAHSNFPLSHVALENMQAEPGLNARSYVVTGRILNHSPMNFLDQVIIEVTVNDCARDVCQVIAQEQGRVSEEIPPGQARDFQISLPLSSSINVQGEAEWGFRVIDVNDR